MSKEARQEDISRREFVKAMGAGTITLGAGLAATGGIYLHERQKHPLASGVERFSKEAMIYGLEGVGIIDEIEENSGLIVPLPETFQLPDFEAGGQIYNEPWRIEELRVISETMKKLPEKFKLRESEVIVGVVRKDSPRIGGVAGYWSKKNESFSYVGFYTHHEYELEGQSAFPQIWRNTRSEFESVLIHELTHKVVNAEETLLQAYAETFGWERTDGKWEYKGEDSGIHIKLLEWYHPDYHTPNEEIAIASSLYLTSPETFHNHLGDIERYDFLSERLYR